MFLYSYFGLCEYSQSPWVSFVTTDSSQWGLQKFNSFLTKWNDPTSKAHKPHNFQSNNSLKLGFFNIGCLPLNLIGCESFLESNSPAILPLCETNLDDSIDFGTSLWEVIYFQSERILLLICKTLQFMWRSWSGHVTFLMTLRILIFVFNWLYFIQYFSSFPSLYCHLLFRL